MKKKKLIKLINKLYKQSNCNNTNNRLVMWEMGYETGWKSALETLLEKVVKK